MTVHYHGLPLTPLHKLLRLEGKHVCISMATQRKSQVEWALKNAQSIMLDNGAFSAFTHGREYSPKKFYHWIEPMLYPPHWAVIPDVIGGSVGEQKALVAQWPFGIQLGAPVWHLHLPLEYLQELVDRFPRVCLGSSGEFWKVGSPEWRRRMDQAFQAIGKRRVWIHGLRMLGQIGQRWPLASADSVNVARNFKDRGECPGCMSDRLDKRNGPLSWPGIEAFI